jgi:hypothetical protein
MLEPQLPREGSVMLSQSGVVSTILPPSLAETSVTGLLVVLVPVDVAPKFSAPCR